ncbi:hypothetical protein AMATHDRAFT_138693, partial [Amanita thiersii Skay4041]
ITAQPSPIKYVYLSCRYYPLLTWPIIMWGFVGNHDPNFCIRMVHVLYILLIPYQLTSQVVMILRSWAFTGRRISVAILLGISYVILVGAEIWVFATGVGICMSIHFNLRVQT